MTLLPLEQQQVLEQRRTEQQTDEGWKARSDVRTGVEGIISQATHRPASAAPATPDWAIVPALRTSATRLAPVE